MNDSIMMNDQIVYLPTSVTEELPPAGTRHFVFCIGEKGVTSYKQSTFMGTGWIKDDSMFKDDVVTHWLKPVRLINLIRKRYERRNQRRQAQRSWPPKRRTD
jgi:hypothetical protein